MIIDCVSDLHGFYPKLEGGDLLIVVGDLTARDEYKQYIEFNAWLLKQKYRKKVLIAGNHDNWIYNSTIMKDTFYDCDYLCDSGTEIEIEELEDTKWGPRYLPTGKKLKIWGSPWTKTFEGMNPNCKAFTCDTEEELASKFSLIPEDTDILITHGPPYGILDKIQPDYRLPRIDISDYLYEESLHVGSKSLSEWMQNKWKVFQSKKINIFGHIHENGGKTGSLNMTQFINCSHVNERYEPVNKPVRVIL